ncbi:hypothetical protein [Chryseobacterium turcicum]|uniref:Uncharacterized protein n=1 Tax=Chryseobacterium turcicum TaxID=2898076 RepID=A0A9Q3V342_9FLAO|nr:hypothetical protein [Chryseobacterium turcicum]MCD1117242.1 hypothetical protein [Chryseobacterium turcicum]
MKKLFLLLLTIFSLIGCTSDDETLNDYIGTWSGTYQGTEKGLWKLVVASDGKVTGTMYNESSNENYNISGFLNSSGQLTAELVIPADGQFSGTLNTEKKGSGSWTNESPTPVRSGSWSGEKDKK